MCNRAHYGNGLFYVAGRETCVRGAIVTNCEFVDDSKHHRKCYACFKGYILDFSEMKCVIKPTTVDVNCRI